MIDVKVEIHGSLFAGKEIMSLGYAKRENIWPKNVMAMGKISGKL